MDDPSIPPVEPGEVQVRRGGLLGTWNRTPLYARIVGGLVLGLVVGLLLGQLGDGGRRVADSLAIPSKLVLRLLSALAPPLILVAIIRALMTAEVKGRTTLRMVSLLLLNTLVAISIGLLVANVLRPGLWSKVQPESAAAKAAAAEAAKDPLTQFLDNVPRSLLGPLSDDGKVLGVIFIAVALGMALRGMRQHPLRNLDDAVNIAFNAFITILGWIITIIPLAIFGIVASIVGTKGLAGLASLGAFVVAVIIALALQAVYYLTRVQFGSWVRPLDLLRGCRDALVMAFSTASSTATMPVTFACLRDKVGLRDQSASMGSLVGANFNNDGTALYEAMSALFISQMIGMELGITEQIMVVLTSVVASVGAAGIPEAGLVTMTLVFNAVGLPVEYIAILLTVDWFLDRCRTAINVMGDMNVSCLLDGKRREEPPAVAASAVALGPTT